MSNLKSDWIRAAVAGATADGREITEQSIQEVADSYSQDVYNARIWPEHLRGVVPGGLFKALGDVAEVKAGRIKGGALDGKLALYVKIEPQPELINMVRAGEKIHLSIEIEPNFADTGGAYLVGLGVTDSPASLGTGIMKFNIQQRTKNLFSSLLPADIVEQPEQGTGTPSPEQFRKLQNDIEALKTANNSEFARLFSKLEEMHASLLVTGQTVEDIGNTSQGRFRRYKPDTGEYVDIPSY